jgi:hypothetical protein
MSRSSVPGSIRRSGLGLVLAGVFALGTGDAVADEYLGGVGGISYVSATTESVPAGGVGIELVACPDARPNPLGAGIYPSGEAGEAYAQWLYPASGGEYGAWGGFRNVGGQSKTATVFAMCTGRRVKKRYTPPIPVPPQQSRSARVKCPKGTHVTGGGANIDIRLVSSHPFDGGDANRAPDDGWAARAYNYTTDPDHIQVLAHCLASKRLRYRTSSAFEANCPDDGHLTGGGVKHRASEASLAWINTSAPLDTPLGGDTDSIPDDRWYARLPSYPRTVYAICLMD